MLIYSMSVSLDGFIADREGVSGWTTPNEELFRFHIALVSEQSGGPPSSLSPASCAARPSARLGDERDVAHRAEIAA